MQRLFHLINQHTKEYALRSEFFTNVLHFKKIKQQRFLLEKSTLFDCLTHTVKSQGKIIMSDKTTVTQVTCPDDICKKLPDLAVDGVYTKKVCENILIGQIFRGTFSFWRAYREKLASNTLQKAILSISYRYVWVYSKKLNSNTPTRNFQFIKPK